MNIWVQQFFVVGLSRSSQDMSSISGCNLLNVSTTPSLPPGVTRMSPDITASHPLGCKIPLGWTHDLMIHIASLSIFLSPSLSTPTPAPGISWAIHPQPRWPKVRTYEFEAYFYLFFNESSWESSLISWSLSFLTCQMWITPPTFYDFHKEAWCAAVYGVTKSWTRLSDWTEMRWCIHRLSMRSESNQASNNI